MPAWARWGLISGVLCVLSWLCGRLSRPHAPAGTGPWETSWAVYFSRNGGAARAILKSISSAQQTIRVQPISPIRRAWLGCWCAPTNEAYRCTLSWMPTPKHMIPRSRPSRSSWERESGKKVGGVLSGKRRPPKRGHRLGYRRVPSIRSYVQNTELLGGEYIKQRRSG
jgi:hypothetical protein